MSRSASETSLRNEPNQPYSEPEIDKKTIETPHQRLVLHFVGATNFSDVLESKRTLGLLSVSPLDDFVVSNDIPDSSGV